MAYLQGTLRSRTLKFHAFFIVGMHAARRNPANQSLIFESQSPINSPLDSINANPFPQIYFLFRFSIQAYKTLQSLAVERKGQHQTNCLFSVPVFAIHSISTLEHIGQDPATAIPTTIILRRNLYGPSDSCSSSSLPEFKVPQICSYRRSILS